VPTPKLYSTTASVGAIDLDGDNREGAIATINRYFDTAEAAGYTNCRLDWQQRDYEDGYEYVLMGDKMETVEQAALREGRERLQRSQIELREREQLARLKEKYDGS